MYYLIEEDKIFETYDKHFNYNNCIIYVNDIESLRKYYNIYYGYYTTISKIGCERELIIRDKFNNINKDKSKKEMYVCN